LAEQPLKRVTHPSHGGSFVIIIDQASHYHSRKRSMPQPVTRVRIPPLMLHLGKGRLSPRDPKIVRVVATGGRSRPPITSGFRRRCHPQHFTPLI
jgi:hypothetical protein